MVATKAQQIPKGGSSVVGKALQRSLQVKERRKRPGLCALAFGAGCLWGEEFKIPSAHASSWAGTTVSPSAGNFPGSWGKESEQPEPIGEIWKGHHNIHYTALAQKTG